MDIPRSGVSDWFAVTQEVVNQFAEATGDRQWIHVDPSRGPTIAHGFLTLSLLPVLIRQAVPAGGVLKTSNYGLNRVRFIAPVRVGSRIRARFEAASVEEKDDATKVTWAVTIESEGGEKPCCVAEWIVAYYG
jgi:acyl dehydratase